MVFRRIVSSVLLFVSLTFSQHITVMSYNVENLFDDVSNGTEYKHYDPIRGHWNREMYLSKLKNIARVITESTRKGPDIVALQEVENKNVVNTLNSMYLNRLGYRYVAVVPREGIATNVAILSRYPIKSVHSYYVGKWEGKPLRNILEVDIEIDGTVLYLFNNHWKSKNGGVRKTESARLKAACVLLDRIKTLVDRDPHADIVVVGDLNENFDEYARIRGGYETSLIAICEKGRVWGSGTCFDDEDNLGDIFENSLLLTGRVSLFESRIERTNIFYEPWFEYAERNNTFGSYVYRGRWETPDHILLFPTLFDNYGLFYKEGHFRVVKRDFMLNPKGYPLRWYCRGKRCRGYSDHLPVLITLYKR